MLECKEEERDRGNYWICEWVTLYVDIRCNIEFRLSVYYIGTYSLNGGERGRSFGSFMTLPLPIPIQRAG